MLELVQIKNIQNNYSLNKIYVNPSHIVMMAEHVETRKALREGKINLDLNPITTFTKLVVNDGERSVTFVVVGEPSLIESKLNKSYKKRKILRG